MCPVHYYCIQYAKPLCHIVTNFLCIGFQLSFYFTWSHFFYTKGVFAWFMLHKLQPGYPLQEFHKYQWIIKWILFHLLYCKEHFVLLIFGISPYCWNVFNDKFSWSTVRYTLYVDQGCAGINCIIINGITYSNYASILQTNIM